MRREYGKALRGTFEAQIRAQLPQFIPYKPASRYLFPGERVFCWVPKRRSLVSSSSCRVAPAATTLLSRWAGRPKDVSRSLPCVHQGHRRRHAPSSTSRSSCAAWAISGGHATPWRPELTGRSRSLGRSASPIWRGTPARASGVPHRVNSMLRELPVGISGKPHPRRGRRS